MRLPPVRTRPRGLTQLQAELIVRNALALGFVGAIAESHTPRRYHVVLCPRVGPGARPLTASTWKDWVAICQEYCKHDLPF